MRGEDLAGIVTDRDLRARLVARVLTPETPVESLMTPQPLTIKGDDKLFDTTLLMTQTRHSSLAGDGSQLNWQAWLPPLT